MHTTAFRVVALLFATLLIGGCYESSDVAIHEPGKYTGKRDPLLQADAQQRADTLAKRFQMVQTDR